MSFHHNIIKLCSTHRFIAILSCFSIIISSKSCLTQQYLPLMNAGSIIKISSKWHKKYYQHVIKIASKISLKFHQNQVWLNNSCPLWALAVSSSLNLLDASSGGISVLFNIIWPQYLYSSIKLEYSISYINIANAIIPQTTLCIFKKRQSYIALVYFGHICIWLYLYLQLHIKYILYFEHNSLW